MRTNAGVSPTRFFGFSIANAGFLAGKVLTTRMALAVQLPVACNLCPDLGDNSVFEAHSPTAEEL